MKRMIVGTTAALMMVAGMALPAHANVVADPVIGSNITGGCISEFAGTGSMNIVVEGAVTAPTGAVSLSVTCHVTQGWRTRDIGLPSALGAAAGGGVITGWDLAPYSICTEIHASFLTGAPYHKYC